MNQNTPPDPQAAATPGRGDASADDRVATGDRREEVRFEADPDQLVKASHLVHPQGPLPRDVTRSGGAPEPPMETEVVDVLVAPESPSVWDARPPAEDSTGDTPVQR
jgi:hypothetical protein